jgi:hypothetical protein
LIMNGIYKQLQKEAVRIAAQYPDPDFYSDFSQQVSCSRRFFKHDDVVARLWEFVSQNIENDFGHGLIHVRDVALDAGALVLIEDARACKDPEVCDHLLLRAQAAGLLHDIRRKEKNHAAAGAACARQVLADYPFTASDIDAICLAIANHEAFGARQRGQSPGAQLLSGCLYDADKFRWGPENFTTTIWKMLSYRNVSLHLFLDHYPRGMAFLKKIRDTFRTPTGRQYGPQFIDLGLAIGDELYEVLCAQAAGPGFPESG